MEDIDYGQFITPAPKHRLSGRDMLYDTFSALAKARQEREALQMQLGQRRDAAALSADVDRERITEAQRAARARELHAENVLGETREHNDATEATAAGTLEQRKSEALQKFMMDPAFRAAYESADPEALAPFIGPMKAAGLTVEDVINPGTNWQEGDTPGPLDATGIPEMDEPVDAISGPAPQAQAPAPSGKKQITGPAGMSFLFDPMGNARRMQEQGDKLAGGMTEAAGSMGPQSAEGTRDAAALARQLVATGMDPVAAAKLATQQAATFAGQASGRRNADVAGARGASRTNVSEERLELGKGTYAWTRANQVLSNLGAKELVLQDRKYSDMLANILTNPNAALDAATSGQWVKLAQGGTGVISDSDMRVFWQQIGGVGDYVEGKVQGLINGQIAAGKRQIVAQAMRQLANRARANLAEVRAQLRTAMETDPNITPEMRAAVLKTYRAEAPAAKNNVQAGADALKALRGGK